MVEGKTLIDKIKKERTKIINGKCDKENSKALNLAKCAYIELETGLSKIAKEDISKSSDAYRKCMINTTSKWHYRCFEEDQKLVEQLPKYYSEGGINKDTFDMSENKENRYKYLEHLREGISSTILKYIDAQKKYREILETKIVSNPEKPTHSIAKVFEELAWNKHITTQLPDIDFPRIEKGIDNTYNHILESCSTGYENHGRELEQPNLFQERFAKMKNITKKTPNKKLIAMWIGEKLKNDCLRDASVILNETGISKKDPIFTNSFKKYLPKVERNNEIDMVSVRDKTNQYLKDSSFWSTGHLGRYWITHLGFDESDWYGHSCSQNTFSEALKEFKNYHNDQKVKSNHNSTNKKIGECDVTLEKYTNGFGVFIKNKDRNKRSETWSEFLHKVWPEK